MNFYVSLCLPHHLSRLKTSRILARIPTVKKQGALKFARSSFGTKFVLHFAVCQISLRSSGTKERRHTCRFPPVMRAMRRTKTPWHLAGRDRVTCCAVAAGRPFLLNLLLGPERGKGKRIYPEQPKRYEFPRKYSVDYLNSMDTKYLPTLYIFQLYLVSLNELIC